MIRAGRRDRPIAELPSIGLRVAILGALAVVVFAVILFRLWFLQILSTQQYASAAENNRLRTIVVPAQRGIILDRSGKTLVDNRGAHTLGLVLMEVPQGRLPALLDSLAERLNRPAEELREAVARNAGFGWIAVADEVSTATATATRSLAGGIPKIKGAKTGLRVLDGDVRLNLALIPRGKLIGVLEALGPHLKAEPDELYETLVRRAGYQYDMVIVKEDLSYAQSSYFLEHQGSYPGIEVRDDHMRAYPHGTLAAHLVGNVGEVTAEQLLKGPFADLRPGDNVGQAGVEYTYDQWLRGRDGETKVEVDAFGRAEENSKPLTGGRLAEPGDNLVLSIDLRIQKAVEKALQSAIQSARSQHYWSANGAAGVVMDAANGELLALASYPTFLPAVWQSGTEKDFKRLFAKGANNPVLNRATQGQYPAGSTFKVVDAVAALEQLRAVSPYTTFFCDGEFEAYKQKWSCWQAYGHGHVNMVQALAQSCDVYFYNIGLQFYRVDRESKESQLGDWARRLGLSKETGVDVPGEAVGRIPSYQWKHDYFPAGSWDADWHPGDTVNMAIGQGFVEVTPLQMAVVYAAIANRGKIVTPHLGLRVEDGAGRLVYEPRMPQPRQLDISPHNLDVIRQGLRLAASSGSGTSAPVFSGYPVEVSGKTGTAEWGAKDDCAWYASYAPANPRPGQKQYVVVVFVEQGGHGGSTAAPAARLIYDALFKIKGKNVSVSSPSD